MEFSEPTRRRALLLLGAGGLAALGASDSVRGGNAAARPAVARPAARPRAALHPTPAVLRPPQPGWTQQKLSTLRHPAHDLRDFVPAPPPRSIALTIDDGPHPEYTPQLLDLLAEHDVKATFSLIGEQVTEYPKIVQRIAADGHQVCNHTLTHAMPFNRLTPKRIRKEIDEAHDRIAQISGITPKFFRSPGGAWSKRVLETASEKGMISIDWDIDPMDWARPGTRHIKRALLAAEPGDILLCHDGGGDRSQTIAALRTVLPKLKKRNLTFVAL